MIVAFCGYAQFHKAEEYERKIIAFLDEIVGDKTADMYLGGYGDFYALAYDCCKKYKENHPKISLLYITPYMTLEYQKNHLEHQKLIYDGIIYPEIEDKPPRFAVFYRNKWMVEKADYIICGLTHNFGGAYKTYCYAKRKKKQIYNVTGKEI